MGCAFLPVAEAPGDGQEQGAGVEVVVVVECDAVARVSVGGTIGYKKMKNVLIGYYILFFYF